MERVEEEQELVDHKADLVREPQEWESHIEAEKPGWSLRLNTAGRRLVGVVGGRGGEREAGRKGLGGGRGGGGSEVDG